MKKKAAFLSDRPRMPPRSSGPKKPVHTEPLADPQAGKDTKHGEGRYPEYSHYDVLAANIDQELGLDDLEVPEQLVSKDLDELLAAWTNPVQD